LRKHLLHVEIKGIVCSASRIKSSLTPRAGTGACYIFCNSHFVSASTTQYSLDVPTILRPNLRLMTSQCFMTGNTRIVITTALVPNCDDVAFRVPMAALSQSCHIDSAHIPLDKCLLCVSRMSHSGQQKRFQDPFNAGYEARGRQMIGITTWIRSKDGFGIA
jgi:hypothetical protein